MHAAHGTQILSYVAHIQSNFNVVVEPAELCREKTGGVAKYDKVVYGEHLVKKVVNNFVL
uniref:Uncharacterized protein n=1 Tax=Aegilops tauschii subsp. strangulata TaxID=200361 RepID=A0A453SSY9_AEGTS